MGAAGAGHRDARPEVPESQGLGLPGAEAAGRCREEPGTEESGLQSSDRLDHSPGRSDQVAPAPEADRELKAQPRVRGHRRQQDVQPPSQRAQPCLHIGVACFNEHACPALSLESHATVLGSERARGLRGQPEAQRAARFQILEVQTWGFWVKPENRGRLPGGGV